jgi:hypothetical protein
MLLIGGKELANVWMKGTSAVMKAQGHASGKKDNGKSMARSDINASSDRRNFMGFDGFISATMSALDRLSPR